MWVWLERRQQRQRELARGFHADLVRYNRRRYKLAFALLGCGCLLGLLSAKAKLSAAFHTQSLSLWLSRCSWQV
jgi:hypothetical protein